MLILNIQFFNGDKDETMKLARLIADLEPVPRTDVTVLFSARFDASHDWETVEYVGRKFPTFTHTAKRQGTGWPAGPNDLMADSYCWCIENTRNRRIRATGILFIESDAVPIHKNWLNLLIEEWNNCGKEVLGAWLTSGDASCPDHINGNCIIGVNFWRKHKRIMNPSPMGGWDADLAHDILPNGAPSKLIWSDYHLGAERNPWKGCDYLWEPKSYKSPTNPLYGQVLQPVYYHGPKYGLGVECVRQRLLA